MPEHPHSPLSQKVADRLAALIRSNHRPGDRLPTVIELAVQHGVSKHTISMALEILARHGLITKSRRNGVCVAARNDRPQRIGILSELDLLDPRTSPYFRAVANALRARLAELDFDPQLYVGHAEPGPGKSDEPTCPQFWTDVKDGKLAGGVILDTPATGPWYYRLQDCPVPLVGPLTNYDVELDFDGITAAAVRRLADQGCRRLGLLSWPGVEPFLRAVCAHGLIARDGWIRSGLDPAVRGAGWEEFREIWKTPGDKPDGLVVLDDMLYADAQLAILELGVRVPQDLRIVTLTNRAASPLIRLPVSAFEVDPAERAAGLVDLLQQRLSGALKTPVIRRLSFREVTVDGVAPAAPVAALRT